MPGKPRDRVGPARRSPGSRSQNRPLGQVVPGLCARSCSATRSPCRNPRRGEPEDRWELDFRGLWGKRGREGTACTGELLSGGGTLGRGGAGRGLGALAAGAARQGMEMEYPRAQLAGRWAGPRPRVPRGQWRLPPAAHETGSASSLSPGCAGRRTRVPSSREAREPLGPVPVRAEHCAPTRARLWGKNVVVNCVPTTCRTSVTPRISCLEP